MLAVAYHSKKHGVFPKTNTVWFCGHEFASASVTDALAQFDTSPWDQHAIVQHTDVLRKGKPHVQFVSSTF